MQLKRELPRFPEDWPVDGPIDLALHDLPHGSSTTEWWYLNTHLEAADGRRFSLFAAFFRVLVKIHPDGRREYSHSLTWALTDPERQEYHSHGLVEAAAPRIGLEQINAGRGSKDERLNRAVREVLEKGRVPRPDRVLPGDVTVSFESLRLDYGLGRLHKDEAGNYHLFLRADEGPRAPLVVELTFSPRKGPVRHGDNGLVRGTHDEDMFYYFLPRCEVTGRLTLEGTPTALTGSGWYDHEFGRPPPERDTSQKRDGGTIAGGADMLAWNWLALQLDDGSELTAYELLTGDTMAPIGRCAVMVDPAGQREAFSEFTLSAHEDWQSTRTFERYPTRFVLELPGGAGSLEVKAAFADQEFVTVMSKPAFWEGRCEVTGTLSGRPVSGIGYLERSGFCEADTLDDFFKGVGRAVRASVREFAPLELSYEHALKLVTSPGRESALDGVDLAQLSRTLIAPVREITDRGGKAWRSYAALACCEVVGGDSRKFAQWLAFPELMHTGSLIVDDVQDKSTIRRGGQAAHLKYGEAIAVNAGTAAYFLGERLLTRSLLSDADKLRVYDLYFEALRAGHAGQAIDLDGLGGYVLGALDRGDVETLERRVLAIHRLKTAAPAAALARMGGIAGGGSAEQVEGVGQYFDSLGLAFQIIDDVLNLRGFERELKQRGEDISQGKLTLPVVKALARLEPDASRALWLTVASQPTDPAVVAEAIDRIEKCGALDACVVQARGLLEDAWRRLDPLVEESQTKVMLRAFGWYVLERHY